MRTYQAHSADADATSDSHTKLARLGLPQDMTGMSFLDIGCSEGFFCNVALERGASRVVGIDVKAPSLKLAREMYGHKGAEFIEQSWAKLPQGPFDVILMSSAIHYEPNPGELLGRIADALAPGGLFILECGVSPLASEEMVLVQRRRQDTWMPTESYLKNTLLRRFAVRRTGRPQKVGGDPTPRSVYHCHHRLPTVVMVRGRSHSGKSSVARLIGRNASKLVSMDQFLARMMTSPFASTPLQEFVVANKDRKLAKTYKDIDARGFTEDFAVLVSQAVQSTDELVVIEGFLTDAQAEAISAQLKGRAVVWDATRQIAETKRKKGKKSAAAAVEEDDDDADDTLDGAA